MADDISYDDEGGFSKRQKCGQKSERLTYNMDHKLADKAVSDSLYNKQQKALAAIPEALKKLESYMIPLRAYNISGIENVRALLNREQCTISAETLENDNIGHLSDLINYLAAEKKKVIFTMGKGGVGKTTIAAAIALGLSRKGLKVHLTTTDPAAHLKFVLDEYDNITMSRIDEKAELKKYQTEVLEKAKESGMMESDLAYIAEDLRSPCTQEIAVFRAFAQIVEMADNEIVIIDTSNDTLWHIVHKDTDTCWMLVASHSLLAVAAGLSQAFF